MNQGKKLLSDLKLYSDYLKWSTMNERYETWNEACGDIISGHRKKYENIENKKELNYILDEIEHALIEKQCLASQRNLQYRYHQINQHNTRMYNCSVLHLVRPDSFQKIMYLSLSGCGVGISLLKPFVDLLPTIQKRNNGTKTYIIEDTIEGWSDALGVLMSSFFTENQSFPEYAGYEIKFDYSKIREKGSYISGGFKAPGSQGLKNSLELVESIINNWINTRSNKIEPILASDIICIMGDAVISGGVRRSALNMIIDPNDSEMMSAKLGDWYSTHPYRQRSNNSVLIKKSNEYLELFNYIIESCKGNNDLGFVFCETWFDLFNPCFEISFTPVLTTDVLEDIKYEDLYNWSKINIDNFGVQLCNLNEINAEACVNKDIFIQICTVASALGTLQAGYNSFPYLGKVSEDLVKREALLGISITGWTNNKFLLKNPDVLRQGVEIIKNVNERVAKLININPAARLTCVKPSGNASVVLGTPSGAHPEHSKNYFRLMRINKENTVSKFLEEKHPYLIEQDVYNPDRDNVIYVPIENPVNGLFKEHLKGVEHLKLIKYIQENWVIPGTVTERGISKVSCHNCSCTVIIDNLEKIAEYIWENKKYFRAISFISDNGDREYSQAPFTSVYTMDEITLKYGIGSMFASGLIVDGLHYFNDLWVACEYLINPDKILTGTKEQVILKKYWIDRAIKFADNYFSSKEEMINCLKDIHLLHKWYTINRQLKVIDVSKVIDKPVYKDIADFSAMSCSGGNCEVTSL